MKLSKADKLILDSYIPVVHNLAAYLGDSFEIVLHSLEDYEHAVIAIANGEHTGRTVGAPITDLALGMLDSLSKGKPTTVYFSRNKKGEPLKSSTIAIHGERNRVIGLLCINMYLNTPLADVLAALAPTQEGGLLLGSDTETFATDVEHLIESNLDTIRDTVMADASILPSNKNRAIIEELERKGIFRLKNAVIIVAQLLDISRNTVYTHIRNYRKAEAEASE